MKKPLPGQKELNIFQVQNCEIMFGTSLGRLSSPNSLYYNKEEKDQHYQICKIILF